MSKLENIGIGFKDPVLQEQQSQQQQVNEGNESTKATIDWVVDVFDLETGGICRCWLMPVMPVIKLFVLSGEWEILNASEFQGEGEPQFLVVEVRQLTESFFGSCTSCVMVISQADNGLQRCPLDFDRVRLLECNDDNEESSAIFADVLKKSTVDVEWIVKYTLQFGDQDVRYRTGTVFQYVAASHLIKLKDEDGQILELKAHEDDDIRIIPQQCTDRDNPLSVKWFRKLVHQLRTEDGAAYSPAADSGTDPGAHADADSGAHEDTHASGARREEASTTQQHGGEGEQAGGAGEAQELETERELLSDLAEQLL
jgi:hypothetical protein